MLPGPALIIKCPHCEGEKKVLTLASGNTFGGHQWWDLKEDYPMLPRRSYVQKCPHCGKYFMLTDAESREGDEEDWTLDGGMLSHEELREAWAQMKETLKDNLRVPFLLEYLWAYNDAFQREVPEPEERHWGGPEEKPAKELREPSDGDREEFVEIVRELIASFPVENRLIHAEFLREARLFDEAMAIVEQEGDRQEGPYRILESIIRESCLTKNSRVGLVVFPEE